MMKTLNFSVSVLVLCFGFSIQASESAFYQEDTPPVSLQEINQLLGLANFLVNTSLTSASIECKRSFVSLAIETQIGNILARAVRIVWEQDLIDIIDIDPEAMRDLARERLHDPALFSRITSEVTILTQEIVSNTTRADLENMQIEIGVLYQFLEECV